MDGSGIQNAVLVIKIVALVLGIQAFFKTKAGDKIGAFLPSPFWVYFLSILFSTIGILPKNSPVYNWFSMHVLAAALFLMLVGAPLQELLQMGSKATLAMILASASVFVAAVASFGLLGHWLPAEGPAAVGALLGTWIGGSANMIAVKEILSLPDETLGALVLVDTILSYTWMALLFVGVRFQNSFDKDAGTWGGSSGEHQDASAENAGRGAKLSVLLVGFLMGEITVLFGKQIAAHLTALTPTAWVLLSCTVFGTALSATKAQKLGRYGSSAIGSTLLYMVLVTIGAKSSLSFAGSVHLYFLLGLLIFLIHGILLFSIGKILNVPLGLLATASQANIGGSISAPIVAAAYRPGTAHLGVLMGIAGAVIGTYLGVAGGTLCQWLRMVLGNG